MGQAVTRVFSVSMLLVVCHYSPDNPGYGGFVGRGESLPIEADSFGRGGFWSVSLAIIYLGAAALVLVAAFQLWLQLQRPEFAVNRQTLTPRQSPAQAGRLGLDLSRRARAGAQGGG